MPQKFSSPQARQEFIRMALERLETPSKELTKWEEDFVASVREQFQSRGTLSDRQLETLDNIYSEKTD